MRITRTNTVDTRKVERPNTVDTRTVGSPMSKVRTGTVPVPRTYST